jgi:anti-sigma regulatory factor (Ser/Thr protein kinase)
VPFVREAIAADEPIMIAVTDAHAQLLRDHLASDLAKVELVRMESVGKNPGRIISAWYDFAERHPGRRLRGIGEPVWPGRRPDEVVACQHHEQLLNVAFADAYDFELVCPYDIGQLPDDVVTEAERSHPFAGPGTAHRSSPAFALDITTDGALTPAPIDAVTVEFTREHLRTVRQVVAQQAAEHLIDQRRVDDLVLAVSEAVTNSVEYNGSGILEMWFDHDRLTVQIRDVGQLVDPLVGRRRPPADAPRGRGIWMAHQICDLVQIRSAECGTTVRLAMERATT